MSMYHTPVQNMVNTRSATRRELAKKTEDGQPLPSSSQSLPPHPEPNQVRKLEKKPNLSQTIVLAEGSLKSERRPLQDAAAASQADSKSRKSSASSVIARRKRLEFQAAQEKAKIQMALIESKLEADLADLDDEAYSPHSEGRSSIGEIDKWLERSQQELLQAPLPVPGMEFQSDGPCPPPPPPTPPPPPPAAAAAGTEVATVQLLVSALKEFSAASASSGPNASLLSRMSTPRDLPNFSGDPMDWLQFKQAFEESTRLCNFKPNENLWRLRKCLHGPAREAVSALMMSGTSPDILMSTLELRFGNPDIIIYRIMTELRKLQPIPQDYYRELVPFSIKVQNFVAAVRAVGREEYLQGTDIAFIIINKLPAVLVSKWSDYSFALIKEGKKPRLHILADFLNDEAVKLSTTASVSLVNSKMDYPRQKQLSSAENSASISRHTVLVQRAEQSECSFCRGSNHELVVCRKFKRALRKARWNHVKRQGICFKCLAVRHDRETCSAPACNVEGCGGPHHRLLHFVPKDSSARSSLHIEELLETTPTTAETVTHMNNNRKVLLKVLPINIHGPNGVISANALLDDGATVTLISADLAARAGLHGHKEILRVRGAWTDSEIVCPSNVLNFDVSNLGSNDVFNISARSIDQLNLPLQNSPDISSYDHLKLVTDNLVNRSDCKPEVLIGQDNFHVLVPIQVCVGKRNEPSATLTPLGWCIHGAMRTERAVLPARADVLLLHGPGAPAPPLACDDDYQQELRDIHEEVRRSFALDSMGVAGKPRENAEHQRAVKQLETTAALIDGRWYVGLPWKDENCRMPDSLPTALRRLKGVEKKMATNDGYAQRYVERVNHLFQNEFATELIDPVPTPRTWYLPHFGVDNPNKKKLRLVFDAAAKTKGLSLNDYLLTGPDLLESLFGVMVRFREQRVAVSGDIKDMFLRVKIRKDDQDSLRFLWRKLSEDSMLSEAQQPLVAYAMTSLIFGANCSPFIAQFIKNKNAERFAQSMPSAVVAVHRQHYMDDYLDSMPDELAAIKMVSDVTYIHKQGGFEICNWTSNSVAVLDTIPGKALGTAALRFKIDQQFEGERTLGLIWIPGTDELGFDLSLKRIPADILKCQARPTKRLVLRVVMSIFDVFGILSPFTIQGKIMIQDTWRSNIDWDDEISDNIFRKWCDWVYLLKVISTIRIPRCYMSMTAGPSELDANNKNRVAADKNPSRKCSSYENATNATQATVERDYDSLQLHLFSDASTKAMCAVAYWRWIEKSKVRIAFVASKCRVAPVKPTSVPRLELQASLLAARLADTVQREHRLTAQRRFFWCDSTTVLHWIGNDARNYKTFVANRLGEIDELTRSDEWRYIPTKLNIADVATREAFDNELFTSQWLNGPTFLHQDESSWPQNVIKVITDDTNLECVTIVQNVHEEVPVPQTHRFSSWLRLLRSMAAVLKFIDRCKKLPSETDCHLLERAEIWLLKRAQIDSFSHELTAIKEGRPLGRNSRLLTLSPYLDEHEVLRCDGRIGAACDVESETKNPVILDGRHDVAKLIVRHQHVKLAHANQETVVNELKQRYWIIKLRPTVKTVVSQCMFCRVRKCQPLVPRMGDLPSARVAHHQRVFSYCGLDLFGPLEVTVARHREKRYGVLFTCLTVRAVHLEIVNSLTSDALIMALRRMAARRGWPRHLYSDNGTNLRGADKELRNAIKEIDEEAMKKECACNGTQWSFIPPASPHWGGAWERLVRSVKTALKVIMNERAPKEEILTTLFAEVENIVNSRPLTHVSVEPGSKESLTPNHFLLGESSNLPVIGAFDDSDLYLRKQWRKAQRFADMFWARWVREVLPELLPRKKWNEEQSSLKVGDLVFIADPDAPRNVWPRGVIDQVFPGKDGRVRMADVRTKSGTLRRSAGRIARLPVSNEC